MNRHECEEALRKEYERFLDERYPIEQKHNENRKKILDEYAKSAKHKIGELIQDFNGNEFEIERISACTARGELQNFYIYIVYEGVTKDGKECHKIVWYDD